MIIFQRQSNFTNVRLIFSRGAGATGAVGATAPIAQTVRGQHGGNRLPLLPELHFEIHALFREIGIYNYF
jgi:hypothetical protein